MTHRTPSTALARPVIQSEHRRPVLVCDKLRAHIRQGWGIGRLANGQTTARKGK